MLAVYARHHPDCASGNGDPKEEDYDLLCHTLPQNDVRILTRQEWKMRELAWPGFASAYV